MALDTGANDLLIDESAARRTKVERVPAQHVEFWCGSRVAVKNAMVQRLEIGGSRVERLPAGTLSLPKGSPEGNPPTQNPARAIWFKLIWRVNPTPDLAHPRLQLSRHQA